MTAWILGSILKSYLNRTSNIGILCFASCATLVSQDWFSLKCVRCLRGLHLFHVSALHAYFTYNCSMPTIPCGNPANSSVVGTVNLLEKKKTPTQQKYAHLPWRKDFIWTEFLILKQKKGNPSNVKVLFACIGFCSTLGWNEKDAAGQR